MAPASLVLLDALGTLVALRPPAPALRAELERRFGLRITLEEAERALAAEIAYYRAHLQEGRDPDALAALRSRCAAVLRAALPANERLATVSPEEMTDTLLAALRFEAYPDARPALEAAQARGQRLVVVSNWDVSLPRVLGRVGLASLLDGVITSAGAGARKPSPDVFVRALALAGVAPDEAIHIGDSPDEDIAGAQAAGIRAVLIRRNALPPPPGVETITTLAELERVAG